MPKKGVKKQPAKRAPAKRSAAKPRGTKPASDETKPAAGENKPAVGETKPERPETNGLIVKTRAEVAKELKARIGKGSVRSLADWFKMGCPDQPGAYNVDEIEAWVRDNVGSDETDDDQSDRAYWTTFKLREQALQAQAERLQIEGQLVEAEVVTRLIERLANTLTSMLAQWPDWVLSLLPSGTAAQHRAEVRKRVGAKVDHLGTLVADLLEEWAEEK